MATIGFQRCIDPNAIDLMSLKGRFAWEKIPNSDIYMPVIFRGETKYFCIKMLRKILPDYPQDLFYRTNQYQYRKAIELYNITTCEIELLNRINSHHARWAYTQQPFTAMDEIVRVSDFLPFYDHLHRIFKKNSFYQQQSRHPTTLTTNHATDNSQHSLIRPNDTRHALKPVQVACSVRPSAPRPSHPPIMAMISSDRHNESCTHPSVVAPVPAAPVKPSQPRPVKPMNNPLSVISRTAHPNRLPSPVSSPVSTQVTIPVTNNRTESKLTVGSHHIPRVNQESPTAPPPPLPQPLIKQNASPTPSTTSNVTRVSTSTPVPLTATRVSSTIDTQPPPEASAPLSIEHKIPVINDETNRKATHISSSPVRSTAGSKSSSHVHCGWIQINKLYSPYVCAIGSKHHQYKIPVSLLTYYDLLKVSHTDTKNGTDLNESSHPFEQISVTSAEIDLINEQCIKHHLRPFAADTKLITLETFYQYCTPSIIFVKELSANEPKTSICKEWSSIVQINGGICRLRNMSTLHEQTVPFIGNYLLKNFILSSQRLGTASLKKPTDAELEFLQLILFYTDLSVNLRHAQLIDIESVQKEYSVDLILLFNDKFPLNVLNYQEKGSRPASSQGSALSFNNTTTSSTIAESTPPPSPPSPANSRVTSELTTLSKSSATKLVTISTEAQTNLNPSSGSTRFLKTIDFHGHQLTIYNCSGIGSNAQRECVSVRSLCNIIAPDSPSLEKLEMKMLRLLRSKNVNRYRPHNQNSMTFTRLIDIRDAEMHWTFLKQEMHLHIAKSSDNVSNPSETSKTNDSNSTANPKETVQQSPIEYTKPDKRTLTEALDNEEIPLMERLNKRLRIDQQEQSQDGVDEPTPVFSHPQTTPNSTDGCPTSVNSKVLAAEKRLRTSKKSRRRSRAPWTTKYAIDDFCILLNPCEYDGDTINE